MCVCDVERRPKLVVERTAHRVLGQMMLMATAQIGIVHVHHVAMRTLTRRVLALKSLHTNQDTNQTHSSSYLHPPDQLHFIPTTIWHVYICYPDGFDFLTSIQGNAPSGMGPGGNQPNDKKDQQPQKKKWEPPLPTRVGKKKKRGPAAASKLPAVFPATRCRLKLLKMERIKDFLLMEEEFIQNQERLKPETAREDKNEEDRTKVDDLRGTPMAVGTLEEIIDDDHAIISTASGPEFYVSIMSFVDKDLLEPSCQVLLHHKTQAVIGVLQDDTDPMVSVMKLDKAPTESYADIGGLESQIQEIKVCIFALYVIPLLIFGLGICRAPAYSPRTIRGDGHQATKGRHLIRCTRNWQDTSRQGRREPDISHLPSYRRFGVDSEISR